MPMPPLSGGGIAMPTAARLSGGPRTRSASKRRKEPPGPAGCTRPGRVPAHPAPAGRGVRAAMRNPPVSPVANKPQIWNPAT
jgi:hypothetical protein